MDRCALRPMRLHSLSQRRCVALSLGWPSGTGKSTVVCAMALGLTGRPALLGRQTAVRERRRAVHLAAPYPLFCLFCPTRAVLSRPCPAS